MISYNDIYEASKKERYSEQLQFLPKNFVLEVANYLKEKEEYLKKEDSLSESNIKTKKQLENSITLFKELLLRRKKKILNLVLIASETGISKQDFENMLNFEKSLFENLMRALEDSDKYINEILNGGPLNQRNTLIIFKEDVEEFIGLEGEKMGPFSKGQISNIPNEIAKILIEDNKAEEIEE
jgi:hypothetical protein